MSGGSELQQFKVTLARNTPAEIERARQTVASRAADVSDARDLLEALGLIDAPRVRVEDMRPMLPPLTPKPRTGPEDARLIAARIEAGWSRSGRAS